MHNIEKKTREHTLQSQPTAKVYLNMHLVKGKHRGTNPIICYSNVSY